MTIKILGNGRCRYCRMLSERTERALAETGSEATLERVEEPEEIYAYGVLALPVLIIDDTIVCQGKVPSVDIIKNLIARRN
jgi:small redox-active disulfide protein 2